MIGWGYSIGDYPALPCCPTLGANSGQGPFGLLLHSESRVTWSRADSCAKAEHRQQKAGAVASAESWPACVAARDPGMPR